MHADPQHTGFSTEECPRPSDPVFRADLIILPARHAWRPGRWPLSHPSYVTAAAARINEVHVCCGSVARWKDAQLSKASWSACKSMNVCQAGRTRCPSKPCLPDHLRPNHACPIIYGSAPATMLHGLEGPQTVRPAQRATPSACAGSELCHQVFSTHTGSCCWASAHNVGLVLHGRPTTLPLLHPALGLGFRRSLEETWRAARCE